MSKQDLLKKYTTYRDNVQWHIDTNKPEGEELFRCKLQVKYYEEMIKDLESISTLQEDEWTADKLKQLACDFLWENFKFDVSKGYQALRKEFDEWYAQNKYYNPSPPTKK